MDTIMDFMQSFLLNIQTDDIEVFVQIYDRESHAKVYQALSDRNGDRAATLIKKHIKGITSRIINMEKSWLLTPLNQAARLNDR
jgi:DNA-binding GntR family transcriptional regulator